MFGDRFDLRESTVRRSTVFPAGPSTTRSYISTALVNDSISHADDLRKYCYFDLDHEFKTYLTTKRPTSDKISTSLLSFRR